MSAAHGEPVSVIIEAFTSASALGMIFSHYGSFDRLEREFTDPSLQIDNKSLNTTGSMDSLDVVTYLLAALGVIVLVLCIIVASLLIYQYCR